MGSEILEVNNLKVGDIVMCHDNEMNLFTGEITMFVPHGITYDVFIKCNDDNLERPFPLNNVLSR